MTPALTVLFVFFLCGPAGPQDLPPDILADQYLLEAAEAMEQGEPQKADRAFKKIEALGIEPPPLFAYFYGKLLAEYGANVEALRKGQSLLKQFVISAGRDSEYYTPTLKLLSVVEAKLEVAERQAPLFRKVNAQMVRVEGGTFTMGCTPEQEDCADHEKPVRQVEVQSFELSKYEVTQELWVAVMGKNPSHFQVCPWGRCGGREYEAAMRENPSRFQNCSQCPVEGVSWDDVQAFLRKLNAGVGRYRLPSEAEWEYAARGGKRGQGYQYAGSDNPDAVAWHGGNSGGKTHPVGQKQANELGLYDLSGNVQEWVQDCWSASYDSVPSDGQAWERGDCRGRIRRGGSYDYHPSRLRAAIREGSTVDIRGGNFGLRLARSLP